MPNGLLSHSTIGRQYLDAHVQASEPQTLTIYSGHGRTDLSATHTHFYPD